MKKLAEDLIRENKKIYLEFGGQGAPYLKELAKLYQEPGLGEFFQRTFAVINKYPEVTANRELFEHGLDLESWLKNPDDAPQEAYLMRGNISITGIMITHSANYYMFLQNGFPLEKISPLIVGATGHSQGVVAAAMASVALKKNDFFASYEKFLAYQLFLGFRAQEAYGLDFVSPDLENESSAIGDKGISPMVAIIGYSAGELVKMVEDFNDKSGFAENEKIWPALFNTETSIVISAPPSSLLAFRKKYLQEMTEKKIKYVYLKTSSPFHSPHISSCREPFMQDLKNIGFAFSPQDLAFPVYSFYSGDNFQNSNEIAVSLFEEVALRQLFWEKAVATMKSADVVFDFGPGKTIQSLTQAWLGDSPPQVYCLSNPRDAKVVFG